MKKFFSLMLVLTALFLLSTAFAETEYKVGDTVTFGNYGGEPIEWLILDADGANRIMISVKAQDTVPFNENAEDGNDWEYSYIRSWLNDTFYNAAFSDAEREQLAEGPYGDKVYLLSEREVSNYFKGDSSRICYPNQKAIDSGAWTGKIGSCWWWLRSSAYNKQKAEGIFADGAIMSAGKDVFEKGNCVRPVIILRPTSGIPAVEAEIQVWQERIDSDELPTAEGETVYAGKLLIAVKDDDAVSMIEKDTDGNWYGIPGELLADSFEDADTLIIVAAERTITGYYVGGGAAKHTLTKIYAVDLHSNEIIPSLVAAANYPPSTITVQVINGVPIGGGASGKFDLDAAAAKILELHTDVVTKSTVETVTEPAIEPSAEEETDTADNEESDYTDPSEDETEFFLSVLNEDIYRETYTALFSGETVQKGSKGTAARGIQQTLIALGQNITADGSVGSKTMEALNNVRRIFGKEDAESINAADYAEMVKWLVFATNQDAAYEWMTDENEGEYLYLRACVQELNDCLYRASKLFEDCEWADGAERAKSCSREMPKTGEIWRNPSFTGKKTSLTFKVNSDSEDKGSLFKIYNEDEELLSCVFVMGSGSGKVKLPGGTYIIKMGTGSEWYGIGDSFGEDGWYETMLFDGGNDRTTLNSGYAYTLTINTTETNGDSVGSENEDWSDF